MVDGGFCRDRLVERRALGDSAKRFGLRQPAAACPSQPCWRRRPHASVLADRLTLNRRLVWSDGSRAASHERQQAAAVQGGKPRGALGGGEEQVAILEAAQRVEQRVVGLALGLHLLGLANWSRGARVLQRTRAARGGVDGNQQMCGITRDSDKPRILQPPQGDVSLRFGDGDERIGQSCDDFTRPQRLQAVRRGGTVEEAEQAQDGQRVLTFVIFAVEFTFVGFHHAEGVVALFLGIRERYKITLADVAVVRVEEEGGEQLQG